MPDCPASDQSGTGMIKLRMPGLVRYWTTPRQTGIFWSGTGLFFFFETNDAGVSFFDADAQLCYKLT
jgi:hypothetical protein